MKFIGRKLGWELLEYYVFCEWKEVEVLKSPENQYFILNVLKVKKLLVFTSSVMIFKDFLPSWNFFLYIGGTSVYGKDFRIGDSFLFRFSK